MNRLVIMIFEEPFIHSNDYEFIYIYRLQVKHNERAIVQESDNLNIIESSVFQFSVSEFHHAKSRLLNHTGDF